MQEQDKILKALTISELIQKLEEFKTEHGDVEVFTPAEDGFDAVGSVGKGYITSREEQFVILWPGDVTMKP